MLKNVPLSELEGMTEILYKQPNANQSVVLSIDQLSNYYEKNLQSYKELFDYFNITNVDTCQFYILQMLVKITNNNYYTFSDEDKGNFRLCLFQIFDNITKLLQRQFIVNKFSVLYITWLKYDYPEKWEDAFKILLSSTYKDNNNTEKLNKLSKIYNITNKDFIVELFLTFDDELIKYRNTYTELEAKRSNILKDYLRDNFVKDLVNMVNQVFNNLSEFQNQKKIILNCTKVIAQLIDWNNLNLFGESVNIILQLLSNEDFQSDALLVLNAIVNKGTKQKFKINEN